MRTLQFLRPLGAGAFGTVYLAELSSGQGFRRPVAVKVLSEHRPDSHMFLSRMRDEARLLGLLQDDSILKVLDMVSVDGRDAVVMEYVEGVDLDSLVRANHAPGPRALAELGAVVAGALSRAHNARHPNSGEPLNVIHRDVKPANLMIMRSGGIKLLDFGIARARFDARESYTGQLVLGTLNYMAPEYIVTGEVSPAADVYGLALSMWEVAAGEVYGQPKVRQDAHERRMAERLQQIQGRFDKLIPVLERMLQWNPTDRPDTLEVERALLAAADAMTGSGLRVWSSEVVPDTFEKQGAVPDRAALVGRTVSLSEPGGAAQTPDGVAALGASAIRSNPGPPPSLNRSSSRPAGSPPDANALPSSSQRPPVPQRGAADLSLTPARPLPAAQKPARPAPVERQRIARRSAPRSRGRGSAFPSATPTSGRQRCRNAARRHGSPR
jgi:eukaryotic-like serine/threonine-protein kinase